jgi:hypothetical protein
VRRRSHGTANQPENSARHDEAGRYWLAPSGSSGLAGCIRFIRAVCTPFSPLLSFSLSALTTILKLILSPPVSFIILSTLSVFLVMSQLRVVSRGAFQLQSSAIPCQTRACRGIATTTSITCIRCSHHTAGLHRQEPQASCVLCQAPARAAALGLNTSTTSRCITGSSCFNSAANARGFCAPCTAHFDGQHERPLLHGCAVCNSARLTSPSLASTSSSTSSPGSPVYDDGDDDLPPLVPAHASVTCAACNTQVKKPAGARSSGLGGLFYYCSSCFHAGETCYDCGEDATDGGSTTFTTGKSLSYCRTCWHDTFPDAPRDYTPTTPPPNSPNLLCDEDLAVVDVAQPRKERQRELKKQRQQTAQEDLKRLLSHDRLPLRRSAVQAMIAMGTMPPVTTREQQLQKEKDMEAAGDDQGMEM